MPIAENEAPELFKAKTTQRWQVYGTDEQRGALFAALAKAQAEFPPIPRTKEVTIRGKTDDGRPYSYTFEYAPLDQILDTLRPILGKHGLCFSQPPVSGDGNDYEVRTILGHSGGAYFEAVIRVQKVPKVKDQGGLFTYLKRYSANGILGVEPSTDDDAAVASGEERDIKDRGGKRSSPPAPPRQKAQPKPEAQKAQETGKKLAEEEAARKAAEEKPDRAPSPEYNGQELSQDTEDRIITLAKALGYRQKAFAARVYELMDCTHEQLDELGGRQLIVHLENEAQSQGILVDG